MKTKARSRGKVDTKKDKKLEKPWFLKLSIKKLIDSLPLMTHSKGARERIQLPVHPSTDLIATMIREKWPSKFRINLDVHRSMHYAGRQLFEYVYLNDDDVVKASKRYKLATLMDDIDTVNYDDMWLETFLGKMMEGYLTHGHGRFSRENIVKRIEKTKKLLPDELHSRCDNFIDDELDSQVVQNRIKERLRKRDYRERTKKIKVVK